MLNNNEIHDTKDDILELVQSVSKTKTFRPLIPFGTITIYGNNVLSLRKQMS